jgi:trans-aconitate methyltransferase
MTGSLQGGEAAFLDPGSFRYLSQVERRMSIVRSLAGDALPARVIDLGCGDGRISLQLLSADSSVTLVDTSPMMLERAFQAVPDRYRDRVRCVQGSIASLDDAHQYDLVLAIGVLGHVGDLPRTLGKISALVAPQGRAIVQLSDAATVPGAVLTAWSLVTSARRGYRLNRLTQRSVVAALADHGMTLSDQARYFALYKRPTRKRTGAVGARIGGIARWAADPWGAERFLVFQPSGSSGRTPT